MGSLGDDARGIGVAALREDWRAIWEGAVNGFALVGVVTCFLIAYLHVVGVPK